MDNQGNGCRQFVQRRFASDVRNQQKKKTGRKKTVIVTGASWSIGATIVRAFLDHSYNVVANSFSLIKDEFAPAPNLAVVKTSGTFILRTGS